MGQVVMVKDNELFPADLLCLYSSLPDRYARCRLTTAMHKPLSALKLCTLLNTTVAAGSKLYC